MEALYRLTTYRRQGRPMKQTLQSWLMAFAALCLAACSNTDLPDGIEPVQDFELPRYLGKWYEIARLDHSFERGLEQVTAEYQRRNDGGVRVINRGYNPEKDSWEEAEGKAYFIDSETVGRLKVSFFGPFYGGYNIFELDENYEYAMVAGPDRSYLWILARTPTLDEERLTRLVERADALGFDTDELIFPAPAEAE